MKRNCLLKDRTELIKIHLLKKRNWKSEKKNGNFYLTFIKFSLDIFLLFMYHICMNMGHL